MRTLASLLLACLSLLPNAIRAAEVGRAPTPWEQIRSVPRRDGLKVFWNVGSRDPENAVQAAAHGFLPVDLLNSYADYPGKQKENISVYLKDNPTNPWKKPEFFERICKRNIQSKEGRGAIFVHDIEFHFEQDIDKAWADTATRAASKAKTKDEFAATYWQEWATWFWQPCLWAKQHFPGMPVGIYGIQPFRRDYWGVAGKEAQQIDGTHANDALLWQHVDRHVDFYVASIYVFYDRPDSIYYMAANVEENWQRSRRFGNKPVYAYVWMRYHDSNKQLAGRELAPYLVEAMAVLPYFSGGRGLVLWGAERESKGQPYQMLPVFMNSLGRVSDLSAKMSAIPPSRPVILLIALSSERYPAPPERRRVPSTSNSNMRTSGMLYPTASSPGNTLPLRLRGLARDASACRRSGKPCPKCANPALRTGSPNRRSSRSAGWGIRTRYREGWRSGEPGPAPPAATASASGRSWEKQ